MSTVAKTLAQEVGHALKQEKLKVVTAESCTGGGLGYWITSIPGSSTWFDRGFITYSNDAKVDLLGVDIKTIDQFGAVSEETAREMVEGALRNSHADIGIAITGIAGPDGGTVQKPVGVVFIACGKRRLPVKIQGYHFLGDRQDVRQQAIEKALEQLLQVARAFA